MKLAKKLLPLFMSIFLCFSFLGCTKSEKPYRAALGTDFTWDCVKAERSVSFRIVPYSDIEDLIIQVSFRDSDLNTLETKTITVGDVIEGNEYVIEHTLIDNAFTEGKTIHGCHLKLHSGIVYLE